MFDKLSASEQLSSDMLENRLSTTNMKGFAVGQKDMVCEVLATSDKKTLLYIFWEFALAVFLKNILNSVHLFLRTSKAEHTQNVLRYLLTFSITDSRYMLPTYSSPMLCTLATTLTYSRPIK